MLRLARETCDQIWSGTIVYSSGNCESLIALGLLRILSSILGGFSVRLALGRVKEHSEETGTGSESLKCLSPLLRNPNPLFEPKQEEE